MRKLKCCECGLVFNEGEAETRSECVGEFWGAPAYKNYNICPRCRSDFLEDYTESEDEDHE